jgi:DNA repair protein RecN (Recombination protein N)
MLRSLYIRDYAIIEQLEVTFDGGLNIITGETGAGKSILIGALSMILGERASTEVVRSGAKKAIIEGQFDEVESPGLIALLEENGLERSDTLILRREISAQQSRAFINDSPSTVQLLRDVASYLIDLHGQHEHQSLLRPETHIGLLDDFGGLEAFVQSYRNRYLAVEDLVRQRKALIARERELARQKELYEFQIEEIDRVGPQEGEEDALEAEFRILENAERLYQTTAHLFSMLYESDDAVNDRLVVARNELQDLARIDKAFEESLGEISSAQIMISEIAKFLQDYNARIEFNPERLEEIRERMGAIELLKRKYGGSLEAVLAYRKEIGDTYDLAVDFEGAIARLNEQIDEAMTVLTAEAAKLSEKRKEVARRIEQAIVKELAHVGIPHARFEVRFNVQENPDGWIKPEDGSARLAAFPNGMDLVEFYISTNVGEEPRPLSRVASGGEVSRIMLSLKTILAKNERLPILVFDEIDTGISGAIARKVGESMRDLARFHQIIAITHLPQIAALGDVHFVVSKLVTDGRTKTIIRRLEDAERAAHIASLISGSGVTEAALESARELMLSEPRENGRESLFD